MSDSVQERIERIRGALAERAAATAEQGSDIVAQDPSSGPVDAAPADYQVRLWDNVWANWGLWSQW